MQQDTGPEGVDLKRPEEIDRTARRLRLILLLPLVWIVLVLVVPDIIMGVLNLQYKKLNSLTDISAIIAIGGALLYLLFTIKQERRVMRILLSGVLLVVISQAIRISRILGLFDGLHATPFEYWYRLLKVLDNALSGFGLVLIAAAFFMAIVDLFAAKRRLALQQEDLSNEVLRRAEVEKEILREKQQYKELIENLPVGVYRNTPGPKGHFLEMNPAHVEMLEADSEDDLLNLNVSDLYRNASERQRVAEKLMREGAIRNEEVQLVTIKGRPITGSVTAVLKYDSSGQPYFDGIIEDVTARVEAERLLEEQRAKLVESARLASLGIMAGGIAHEINNPLAVIEGCAERLESHVNTLSVEDTFSKKYLGMISENAERIQKIIQGLSALSRDASQDPFVSSKLAMIFESTLELCRERFLNNNVSFTIEMPEPTLALECRPVQVGQVIINLLNNAFDAVQGSTDRRIRLAARGLDDRVEILVEDNGQGIPDEITEKLFVPFFTTKSEGRGVGLGLSISRAIIEAHHGTIKVESASGNTRFSVCLPYTQPREATTAE